MTTKTEITLKPRKRPLLWQAYLHWNELVELRKRHLLRVSAIERGAANLDATFERNVMEHLQIDALIRYAKKTMVGYGETTAGPVWAWLTSIRGLGEGGLAAQLIAQIDDIESFTTVSKLWRFCGYAVIDGQIERGVKGEKSHYNRRLKSVCYLIADQFIKQQTSPYVEVYYEAKRQDREAHPETMCRQCGIPWEECKSKKAHAKTFNDGHIHHRAMRKMVKLFLSHLWVVWREAENLPITLPYAHAILGHTHYMAPAGE